MLPNISNNVRLKDINIDLSEKFIGKKINIKNNSEYSLNDYDLNRIITIENIEYASLYKLGSKILNQINFNGTDIENLLPLCFVNQAKKGLSNIFKKEVTSYYFDVLKKRYELTNNIKESVYDHSETITGRMKIIEGVNYLTMKKSDRLCIDINSNNYLVEIDIKSCEPALLHSILYNEIPSDVYSYFAKDHPRGKVKLAVISSIYGSSIQKVKKMTGISSSEIKKIRNHFQLDIIKSFIENEYNEKGYFFNLYGRPIKSINSPVNYWLQSSSADYACLAFLNLINRTNINLRAVIHDAILIEASKSQLEILKKIKKIKDPISNICLNVEHSIIK